ncbi:MAG: Tol-Pal system beta propeller repeat protein TolB [Gammaproteobacteria bacterium]
MSHKGWLARGLAAVVLFQCLTPAHAELVIDITRGVQEAVPVAIVPFGWRGGSGAVPSTEVAAVIASDLARSGRFEPIGERDMIGRPTAGAEVDFSDWRLLGVEALVMGRVLPSGPDAYNVQFELFDVFGARQLIGLRVPANPATLRAVAHYIADLVYEELTGEPGAFSARIAYVAVDRSDTEARYRLVVADSDGENPIDIVTSPTPLLSPTWSPDGSQIAYVALEDDGSVIYLQTLTTGERRVMVSEPGINSAPAFSPDGKKLALTLSRGTGNLDIYVMNIALGTRTRITRSASIDTEPVWSPDGRSILFTSDRGGGPQIYQVDAKGGNATRLTFEGSYNARPRVSPDGTRLAVVHQDRGGYRIAVVDLKNRSTQVLTDGQLDESPSFAPNGQMIIYATKSGGRGVLAAVAVDGSVSHRLAAREGDVREPVWSPLPRR